MLDIRKIVYATDFSPCSENAFPIAVRLAASHDAELHMVHAIVLHADDPHDPAHHFPAPDELYERMRSSAEARMATTAENGGMPDVKIVRAQVRGISPAPVILEYAEEQGVDLIVMGTHGRRGLRHLLLGSVAEEVVRMADCPVLTVREDAESASAFRQILVPMDYSENSELALGYAKEIALSEGARLHLLHVLEVGTYPDFYFPVQASQMFDMPELKEKALSISGIGWRRKARRSRQSYMSSWATRPRTSWSTRSAWRSISSSSPATAERASSARSWGASPKVSRAGPSAPC